MNKLKPCPFCEGKAETGCFQLDYPTANVRAYVSCKKCKVEIYRNGRVADAKKLLANAIEAWNTRKSEVITTQGDKLRQIFGKHVTDDMMINHNRVNCHECILNEYCNNHDGEVETCKAMWQMFLESEVK